MFKKLVLALFLFLISSVSAWAVATSDAYYQAGNKLYMQGNYDLCIRYYKAAIQVDPQNWKAYQALGSCEYHMGLKDAAISDFNHSLTINPNNPPLQGFVNRIQAPAAPSAPSYQNQATVGDSRLPKKGSISWTIGWAVDSLSYQDLVSDFAPTTLTFSSEPIGVEFDLGADYTLSQNIQLGAQIQFIEKEPEVLSSIYSSASDIFTESCIGLAVGGKYLIPLSDQFRLIVEGQVGYYTLVGTTENDGYEIYNFNGSSVGGLIGVEIEWVLDHGGWGIDFGLGYRALSFGSLSATTSTTSGTYGLPSNLPNPLPNNAGTGNFIMDFSGLRVNAAVRFF